MKKKNLPIIATLTAATIAGTAFAKESAVVKEDAVQKAAEVLWIQWGYPHPKTAFRQSPLYTFSAIVTGGFAPLLRCQAGCHSNPFQLVNDSRRRTVSSAV